MKQSPDFEVKGKDKMEYKLRKNLNELKQAPRPWNKRIDNFLIKLGFNKCTSEHEMYVKGLSEQDQLIMCLYVDDMLFMGSNEDELVKFKTNMKN